MTREIPTPLRAAAGLAAVAVDEARRLPSRLAGLPVVAAGAAMQASMKLQQRYADLVGKGDQLIGALGGGTESPSWATFDDDVQAADVMAAQRVAEAQSWAYDPEEVSDELVDELAEEDADSALGGASYSAAAPAGGAPLEGYDKLSLAQLRARLRKLTPADLAGLLAYEQDNEARPPYLTMLQNRLTSLGHG